MSDSLMSPFFRNEGVPFKEGQSYASKGWKRAGLHKPATYSDGKTPVTTWQWSTWEPGNMRNGDKYTGQPTSTKCPETPPSRSAPPSKPTDRPSGTLSKDIISNNEGMEFINIKKGDTLSKLLQKEKIRGRFEDHYGKGLSTRELLDKYSQETGHNVDQIKAGQKLMLPGANVFDSKETLKPNQGHHFKKQKETASAAKEKADPKQTNPFKKFKAPELDTTLKWNKDLMAQWSPTLTESTPEPIPGSRASDYTSDAFKEWTKTPGSRVSDYTGDAFKDWVASAVPATAETKPQPPIIQA